MMHQVFSITIEASYREKADGILLKYWNNGDIDTLLNDTQYHADGYYTITYWLQLYCSEDIEAIKNEFQENGIKVL